MDIGAAIKRLRNQSGLTQYQLAEYLNVSMQTVSRWETSVTYPDIFMLPLLAKRFGVTVDYLLNNGGKAMTTIESERLRIREWDEGDAKALHEIDLKQNYLTFKTLNDSLEMIKVWKVHQEMFPVFLKETGQLVGIAGLVDVNRYKGYCELEVHLRDEYNDVSLSTELHKLILDYGFREMGLLTAFALCGENDEILKQAMTNAGLKYEGTLRRFSRNKKDSLRYSVLKEEYGDC
jgi:transcriptional regulator with XRE-family HTH domain